MFRKLEFKTFYMTSHGITYTISNRKNNAIKNYKILMYLIRIDGHEEYGITNARD